MCIRDRYIITYTASDSKGNKDVLEITVIVKEVQNIPTPDVPETPEKPEEPDQNPETPDEPNQKPETPEKPQDKEAPVFDYEGETDIVLENGQIYKIPEIKANDNVDGEVKVVKTIRKYDSDVYKRQW